NTTVMTIHHLRVIQMPVAVMIIRLIPRYHDTYILSLNSNEYLVNFSNNKVYSIPSQLEGKRFTEWRWQSLEYLVYNGILDEFPDDISSPNDYSPTRGTFLLTSVCNLECIYCYAANPFRYNLSLEKGKKALEYLVQNCFKTRCDRMAVRFHGVGEPTLNWDVLVGIAEHAADLCSKNNIRLELTLATNGILTDAQRAWLGKNMTSVSLSFDGFAEVQNSQRPHAVLNSFETVLATLNSLVEAGVPVSVQTTVTEKNVDVMPQWTEFLADKGVKHINFQPVSFCGRCNQNRITDVDADRFVLNYLRAKGISEGMSIKVHYSGVMYNRRSVYHCGAYTRNFVVTPNGLISTCYEIFAENQDESQLFLIGSVENEVIIDMERVRQLWRYARMMGEECKDCFSQYNCGGGCLSRRCCTESPQIKDSLDNKCNLTRKLLLAEVSSFLKRRNLSEGEICTMDL
ncbi:MAG: radical SAM protein, partial [Bacillota bacterium]